MRVLVVDDDPVTTEMLAENLQQFGYSVTTAADGAEALELIRTGCFRLVVSDWQMPGLDGLELCRQIRQRHFLGYVYFILLTSNTGVANVVNGLAAGADDFLSKPFHTQELVLRLRTGERILGLESRDLMIFAMAKLAESRDYATGAHLERMREYSRLLADELSRWPRFAGTIDGEYVQLLYLTSPLHDIGKVGIPDAVLLKPGPLTRDEFEIMKRHTVIGGETLRSVAEAHPEAHFLTMAEEIALAHHEHFDGQGYPFGLKGEAIPLCGRIVALADVYDALTSPRVYKPAYRHDVARELIIEQDGRHFDPDVVEAFRRREADFIRIGQQFHDGPQLTSPATRAARAPVLQRAEPVEPLPPSGAPLVN